MRDYTVIDGDNGQFSIAGKSTTYHKQGLTITVRQGESRVASIVAPNLDYTEQVMLDMSDVLAKELKKCIKSLNVKRPKSYLVVGLGNAGMTADALGVATLKKVDITPPGSSARKRICTFAPSVSGLTGIDSNDVVKGVVNVVLPDVVILVDTLATSDVKKLSRVAQVKNTGLVPGGGVGNNKPSLNSDYLGVPVISIGVPLVIYLRHVVATYVMDNPAKEKMDDSLYTLVVTPKEIDYTVEYFSTIIAKAIEGAIQLL